MLYFQSSPMQIIMEKEITLNPIYVLSTHFRPKAPCCRRMDHNLGNAFHYFRFLVKQSQICKVGSPAGHSFQSATLHICITNSKYAFSTENCCPAHFSALHRKEVQSLVVRIQKVRTFNEIRLKLLDQSKKIEKYSYLEHRF